MKPYLSLIIPAYNEEKRISDSLGSALNFLDDLGKSYEIIVVDDGSTDKTTDIVNKYETIQLIKQPHNMGKGAAVRRGMLEAKGDIRIFSDADFSTPVYEISKLLDKMDLSYDVAIGSRAVDYSFIKKHQPWYREFMGKTFNRIVQIMLMKGIVDTQCGFKGFKAKPALEIFSRMTINGFGFDIEALYLARQLGYKVAEVPVEWYNDENSKVSPVRDSITMFFDILRVRKVHNRL